MRNADGYATVTSEDGHIIQEIDTYKCGHCGMHQHIRPGTPPYATCKRCMGFICGACYHKGGCEVDEQMLLRLERDINRKLEWQRNLGQF